MVATKSPQISIAWPRRTHPASSRTASATRQIRPHRTYLASLPRMPVQHRTSRLPGKDVKLRVLPHHPTVSTRQTPLRIPGGLPCKFNTHLASTRQTSNAMHKVQVPHPPRWLPVKPRPPETHHPLQNPGQARYSNGREISHKSSPRWLTLSRS
jgi:hypothetical protein